MTPNSEFSTVSLRTTRHVGKVMSHRKRKLIEMALRFTNSELVMESPRLWRGGTRLKLLGMVTLAYTFLLSLPAPADEALLG